MKLWDSWTKVPPDAWRWRNFTPAEMACKGSGAVAVDEAAMDRLQALRDRIGRPLIIVSAYRSPRHNRAVGGAPRSYHLQARAFDVAMQGHDPPAFEATARAVGFTGFGFYPAQNFMHVDIGPARIWGRRWPDAPKPIERTA